MKLPSLFRRSELADTFRGFRREFAVCMVFTVVVNILMLAPTLYMLQIFDRVLISQSVLTLIVLTAITLFFFALTAFTEWSRGRLLVRLGVRLDAGLNSRVFRASFASALHQPGGNRGQALTDLATVRQFMTGNGLFAFMDAPWTPIYTLVLFMLHPWLGVLAIIFSLLLVMLAWLSHRVTHAAHEAAMEAGSLVGSQAQGKLRNAEVIEAMGMLGNLRRLWQRRHREHLALSWRANDLGARMQALAKFLRYTQQSLALGAGALLVIDGELSPGAMIAANVLMGRATQPLDMMVSTWKSFLGARIAFRRLDDLLARHPAPQSRPPREAPQGHVRIENLVARAATRQRPILNGLTADFPAGQVIGIIGPSGSGKSTLARALLGIWPGVEGRVLIDGEPVDHCDREQLGPHLGYLPQDIELFDGSIAENIARFGELDPGKVIRACERSGVHDMILRFPKGYDTQMGDAGGALSGGQRQRIGLARALYGEPCVVVLDEPNSSLDDLGDAALMRAVQDLKQRGSTVFLITHRHYILAAADRLLVLDDGVVTHDGPREDVAAALRRARPPAQGAVQPA